MLACRPAPSSAAANSATSGVPSPPTSPPVPDQEAHPGFRYRVSAGCWSAQCEASTSSSASAARRTASALPPTAASVSPTVEGRGLVMPQILWEHQFENRSLTRLTKPACGNPLRAARGNARETVSVVGHGEWVVDDVSCRGQGPSTPGRATATTPPRNGPCLNRLWRLVNDRLNYLTPTKKPEGYGNDRTGRRTRLHDKPQTPRTTPPNFPESRSRQSPDMGSSAADQREAPGLRRSRAPGPLAARPPPPRWYRRTPFAVLGQPQLLAVPLVARVEGILRQLRAVA